MQELQAAALLNEMFKLSSDDTIQNAIQQAMSILVDDRAFDTIGDVDASPVKHQSAVADEDQVSIGRQRPYQ